MTANWHTSCEGPFVAFRDACSWAVLLGKNETVKLSKSFMQKSNQTIFSTFATAGKVCAAGVALALTGVLHAAPANTVPGRILVKPRDGITESDLHQLFAAHGAQQHDAIHQINVRILNVPEAASDHVLEALQHSPRIDFAEPDYLIEPSVVPNDTYYSDEWHLPKIAAPTAWTITSGSSSVVIAILDSGIDATHPDLTQQVVPGWNFYDGNSDTKDYFGHGTLVAGAAGAASNNGNGVTSVAGGCRIMPIRVSDTYGYASSSAISQGLTWAADKGVRVANLSFANVTKMSSINSAAQYFQSKGGVVVAAAGNDAMFDSTPDNPNFLMVSATDANDSLATFSNTGNNVDIAAPGVSILTTKMGGSYAWAAGTSLSTPIVAGVAALVISVNPNLTGTQIQEVLKTSADDLGPAGWDASYGYGRVNAYKAVLAATGGTPPPSDTTPPTTAITAPAGGSILSGTVSVSIAASDNIGVTKVELYLNGALAGTTITVPATFSWNTTTRANGSCNLQAKAYDAAGNSSSSTLVSVTVQNPVPDTTAPSVQIASPTASSTLSGQATVAVAATDNVGVTRTEWYLNGALMGSAATGSAAFAWNTTSYANGSYTVQARAYDAAGNSNSSAPETVLVQNAVADTAAPAATINAPAAGSTVSGIVSVSVSATDNVGVTRVEWYLNGTMVGSSASSSAIFSWNTTTRPNGSCTLQAKAFDAAGNVGSSSVTVTVNNVSLSLDTVPPTVQITSPTSGAMVVKNTKVYVTANDNVAVTRVDLMVDGKLYSTSSLATTVFSWTTTKIAHGGHTLTAVAYDAAGNRTTSASVTVNK